MTRFPSKNPPRWVVFVFLCVLLLPRLSLAGITFEEARLLEDARHLGAWMNGDATMEETWFGEERPSPAKILSAAGISLLGETRLGIRLFHAILYAWAVATVFAAVRRPRGFLAASASALSLVAAPPFSAFSVTASNELAVVSFLLLALTSAASASSSREWRNAGLFVGLAVGTKISGVIALLAIPLWGFFYRPGGRLSRRDAMIFSAAALAAFLFTWPPLLFRPVAAWEHINRFAPAILARPPLLLLGLRDSAPWWYAPAWLLLGLPPIMLLLAAIGLSARSPFSRLLLLFFSIGLFISLAAHGVLREGFRHLLPLGAILAIAGGMGIAKLAEAWPRVAQGALVFLFLSLLHSNFHQHPFQSHYITEAAGGRLGAWVLGTSLVSSVDGLTDDVLARIPEGRVALVDGGFWDRPLVSDNPLWREIASRHASRAAGHPVRFVPDSDPHEWELLMGAGERRVKDSVFVSSGEVVLVSLRRRAP